MGSGRAERDIGQRHVGASLIQCSPVAPSVAPHLGAALMGTLGNMPDSRKEKTQRFRWVGVLLRFLLELQLVEAAGIEPASASPTQPALHA
jgi:hypothetical protein